MITSTRATRTHCDCTQVISFRTRMICIPPSRRGLTPRNHTAASIASPSNSFVFQLDRETAGAPSTIVHRASHASRRLGHLKRRECHSPHTRSDAHCQTVSNASAASVDDNSENWRLPRADLRHLHGPRAFRAETEAQSWVGTGSICSREPNTQLQRLTFRRLPRPPPIACSTVTQR